METVVVMVAGLVDHDIAVRVWRDRPGSVLVRHVAAETCVRRWVDGIVTEVDLLHNCVSCTVREDLRELLGTLAGHTVVLHLDPLLEPDAVRRNLGVDVECVITVIDAATWLDDALSDASMTTDQRTVAQVVVAQAEAADVLVLQGNADERTLAVLDRLAPGAHRCTPETVVVCSRTRPRMMPLTPECGVSTAVFTADRPFHPARLNDALDSLLDGTVVRSRGRLWVADEPEIALHLESAGCGMHVGEGGPREGKTTQIVAITLGEPEAITGAFEGALLTDDELSFVDSIRKLEM
ncbi:cobalamin biosynthesis protein CobW [Lentzea sp. NEAU-D13]|uniref:Cobalamin biosynthesis protein CobW n=1 Tax=Lentzea alba TaxID=2714351 RepID=A0A7C9VVX1_9PSEU|nr:GTP-binding protein [Lentzea alba]NGY59197.1 cobalamin biosynthesis protein CobW [Lentzea alba]